MPTDTKPTLTLNRKGEFKINATGPNHCGITENLTVRYDMTAVCGTSLGPRGILFEQLNVDKYFQSIRRTQLSCEKLTMSCLNFLVKMIRRENPICNLQRLELTLSPEPFKAAMTYHWEPEQDMAA